MPDMVKSDEPNAGIKIDRQSVREVVGVCGAVLAGYGAWLHYAPAGFMVAGAVLVGLAVIGTLRGGN
ncbi:hypothetical protein EOD08_06760 [Mesorhizobium sp. M6A.T.Ca.TU.002.02.2.1]|nr:hypothetical protein EOD08_06760 [Mesorhizobium sp. M6A.T.Ca.TU.002.02.2.1]